MTDDTERFTQKVLNTILDTLSESDVSRRVLSQKAVSDVIREAQASAWKEGWDDAFEDLGGGDFGEYEKSPNPYGEQKP